MKDKIITADSFVCEECGGVNIQTKAWVDVHTNEVISSCSDGEIQDNWCDDCNDHTNFITKKEYEEEA